MPRTRSDAIFSNPRELSHLGLAGSHRPWEPGAAPTSLGKLGAHAVHMATRAQRRCTRLLRSAHSSYPQPPRRAQMLALVRKPGISAAGGVGRAQRISSAGSLICPPPRPRLPRGSTPTYGPALRSISTPEVPMNRLWTTPVTSSADGHQHDVTDEAYQAYRSNGAELVALCSHEVRMQAGASPPGVPCRTCHRITIGRGPHAHMAQPRVEVEQLQARLGIPAQRIRTRHRRRAPLFLRLLHHSGPSGRSHDHRPAPSTRSARGSRSDGTTQ